MKPRLLTLSLALALAACGDTGPDLGTGGTGAAGGSGGSGAGGTGPTAWEWNLPDSVPPPRVPEDNPMNVEKVELGRWLFYDKRLSGNLTQSCASCHFQELAFTDGLPMSPGSTGELTPRGSMSLANAGYAASLTWANDVLVRLERQALIPMFGEEPVELGLGNMEDELLERMNDDEQYPDMFAAAFPEEEDPVSVDSITKALASFQRSLTSFGSKVDQWAAGDTTALNESEQRGLALFFGGENAAGVLDAFECFHCHGGFLYSQSSDDAFQVFDQKFFVNNGLYSLDPDGSYPPGNQGIFEMTGDPADKGRFKPPTLRNIALTAPYMHDGSLETLDDVIDHYARGGTLTEEGPNAGDGFNNPNKSAFLNGFEITEQEREDLKAFLRALTDESFITDPAFSDPFLE
ncbi:MAG: MbnH family di-heme enzyme [Myxococcota bacterium]